MTENPRLVISALKLAQPSPQPRIFRRRSVSVRSNIRSYSRIERPHGTIWSSRTLIPPEVTLNIPNVQARSQFARMGDVSPADRADAEIDSTKNGCSRTHSSSEAFSFQNRQICATAYFDFGPGPCSLFFTTCDFPPSNRRMQ